MLCTIDIRLPDSGLHSLMAGQSTLLASPTPKKFPLDTPAPMLKITTKFN